MELYYVGTRFELEAGKLGLQIYMLTECFNAGSVFAVVSITGYYSGRIYGYIREQPDLAGTHRAVTEEYLKNNWKHTVFWILCGHHSELLKSK